MLARDGPHIEVVTWALVKVTPRPASSVWTFFITLVPSERSSSLRITTTLSRSSTRCLYPDESLPAVAPTAPKTSSSAAATQIHTTLRNGCNVSLLAKRCLRLPKVWRIAMRAEDTARVGLSVTTLSITRSSYVSAADARPERARSRKEPQERTRASLGETCRKWKSLPVVVADRDRRHRRLLLQPQHRLDIELANDVHVRPRVVAP